MKPVLLLLLAALAGLAACAGPVPADLAACALERKADLPLQVRGGVPFAAVAINGQPATMLVDTGVNVTVVALGSAPRLGLRWEPRIDTAIVGGGGTLPVAGAWAERIALGEDQLLNRLVVVGPLALPGLDGRPIDGLIGTDVLSQYDVDLDLPNERMTLYRARPCAGARPPWSQPWTQVEAAGSAPGRLHVGLHLDGIRLASLLDTGASITTVSRRAALAAGATEDDLAQAPRLRSASLAPQGFVSRVRHFRELRVGDDVRRRPVVLVGDLPAEAGDAVLGGDYFTSRRLWLSFATGQVFVSNSLGQPRPR